MPSWTGINQLLTTDIPTKATIAYLPVTDASRTELNIYCSADLADALELQAVVVVVDQAIYAKMQVIQWQTPNFTKCMVVCLGAFHTLMMAMACIGKRFGDAGLNDILTEAEVVASGPINGVISGHHYNCGVRAHKLLAEALKKIRWQSFINSLPPFKADKIQAVVSDLHNAFPNANFQQLNESPVFEEMLSAYELYIKESSKSNATFAFWTFYLQIVQNVLLFIRALRKGDWDGHLASVCRLLPWVFAELIMEGTSQSTG